MSASCPGCGDPDWKGWYCEACDPSADHPPKANEEPEKISHRIEMGGDPESYTQGGDR